MLLLVPTPEESSWTTALNFALLPAGMMVAGALLAAWRTPGPKLRSTLLHFAAGVVFAVVAVDLLPDIVKRHAPLEVGVGFSLGLAVMFGLRYFGEWMAKKGPAAAAESAGAAPVAVLPWGLLGAVAIDVVIDGLLLGIGFAAGAKAGALLAVAITMEMLTLSLTTAVELRRGGQSRTKTVSLMGSLAAMLVVSAVGGFFALRGASDNVLEVVLSFGLAALLFLVTEELLNEAHEGPEGPVQTLAFFGGFLLFLLVGMMT